MSYQYPYIEHFSPSPASSTPQQPFAQWDIQDDPSNTSTTGSIVQQSSSTSPKQDHQPVPTTPQIQTTYEMPPVIQLTERPQRRVRVAQQQPSGKASPETPIRNISQLSQHSSSLSPKAAGRWVDLRHTPASGEKRTELHEGGPARAAFTSRAGARQAAQPYQRRVSSGEAKSKRLSEGDTQLTRVGTGASYTLMACGAPANNNSSPTQAPSSNSSPSLQSISEIRKRVFLIRTDVHYSFETNTLTAMLELPGVKKTNLRLSLTVCPYSKTKQLVVTGKSTPGLPEEGFMVRERKHGDFKRVLVVPPETTADNLYASLEDGILFLKYPGGSRSSDDDEGTSIPIV